MNKMELDLIKQGILNEIEGYEFYKIAAQQATKEATKNAFISIADEKMMHVEWLKELFEKMTDENEGGFTLKKSENPSDPQLLTLDKVESEYVGLAMSILSIAMQKEQASIEFYEKSIAKTEISQAKALYQVISRQEKEHYEQFVKEHDNLADDWWADQGFAPF